MATVKNKKNKNEKQEYVNTGMMIILRDVALIRLDRDF